MVLGRSEGFKQRFLVMHFFNPVRYMKLLELVTEEERRRWWARKTHFWLYPVVSRRRLRAPIPVDYPQGPQVFVRPENLTVRRI